MSGLSSPLSAAVLFFRAVFSGTFREIQSRESVSKSPAWTSCDASGAWSAERLTVYTTYRIVKELYGGEYALEHYVKKWQEAADDYEQSFYVRHPEYLEMLPAEKRLEITNRLSYVRKYCEMPLKILKAEQLVGGEAAMDRILNGLFNREPDPAYPYLSYQEFLDACGLTEEELNLA